MKKPKSPEVHKICFSERKDISRILIIEDNPFQIEFYKEVIKDADLLANVLVAMGVETAVRYILEGVDLLITDGLRGGWREIVEAAQAQGLTNDKIVVASGNQKIVNAAQQLGVGAYLKKNFLGNEIRALLQAA